MIRVEIRIVKTKTRARRIISNRGKTRTTIREMGVIKLQGILASKPPRTIVLLTPRVLSVGRITQGNADRELPYVTSAIRKGITLGGVQLRLQVMIGRTGIRNRNLGCYKQWK